MNQKATHQVMAMYGSLFDHYLARGFYRMRRNLFTTDEYFDIDKLCMFDIFWLRTKIHELPHPNTHKIWKLNKHFEVHIGPAKFNAEIDELYERYRKHMKFDAHESIQHFMIGEEKFCDFNSGIIEIRDEQKLIAAGYFDMGANSIAGNLNFYDPHYKKYSLGKYLMLRKIDFAQSNQFTYYYTGYLAVDNSKFDYKLFPDANAVEVLIKQENLTWFPYNNIQKEGLIPFAKWANLHKSYPSINF
ncbi:MAG: arginine-tRNA-protein transferase [Bacteroidota bacterium]|nr:arginine-tRNA-protein transferase [Bacteroidota bacterium]